MNKMAEKFVTPGDEVKTEKKPGSGLYEEGGKKFALAAGTLKEGDREAFVEPINPPVDVKKGDTVIVSVESARDKIVLVKMLKVVGKQRTLPTRGIGVIRVMDISPGYTDRASDEFKAGDVVKAEVAEVLPDDVVMTTKGPNLGVIEGYCAHCRGILRMEGEGKLVCTVCGKPAKRKASRDYLIT